MRILITGGTGFIGSHLAHRLIQEGNEVICLDNLFSSAIRNIEDLLGNDRFTFLQQDVMDPFDVEVDQIYHLACPASPIYYQKDPVRTVRTSVQGAINVLDLAKKTGARVLLTSTSEIYGDPLIHPQPENYRGNVSTIGPRACYDEGKRVSETLFFDYHRQYGVDIRVVRIFNTYGPRMAMNDGRVVSNFIVAALQGRNVEVYGDGSQTRSFCFVDDTVEALIRMMNQEGFTGPVNIGNPDERTVKDLAGKVITLTGADVKVIYRELPQDDPVRRKPDISLAKEKLQWRPTVTIDEGLEKTIAYFKTVLNV